MKSRWDNAIKTSSLLPGTQKVFCGQWWWMVATGGYSHPDWRWLIVLILIEGGGAVVIMIEGRVAVLNLIEGEWGGC